MRIQYMFLPMLAASLLIGAEGIEYSGVMVTVNTAEKKQINYLIERKIPAICKKVPINNEMLWTGNFANPKVPEACKSTYVHTKGKLQPLQLYDDLETYGELEVLAFIKKMQTNDNLLLVDSRKESWFNYMTIPGAINMPFNYFKKRNNYEFHFEYALKYLGVTKDKEGWYDFRNAKTLLLFCNGPWCSQSPAMIHALREIGYPVEKLKWYRGGMQDWLGAGLTSTRKSEAKR
ncbi:rhodanese-like domain-containing protein [Sulfurovum riftiae]|uniref:Rhodanese domain-containing protein n=1 Tax=Sulfurovum riftiae TaxID=1630136 RepID=A0A151CDY5_9BACT|nr:rhodanese-like domain-containing protein [Sulfurovum riftiae]KYJ85730.1 hypothetical protein AS592_03050 [Sulfurovum riftiae]